MSIVSLESADEKNVSASILNFLTAYGVISLLSNCRGTKLKGVPVKALFTYTLTNVFRMGSFYMQNKLGKIHDGFSKNTYYRFLMSPRTNWLRFTTLLSARIINGHLRDLTSENRDDCFVIDDSLYERAGFKRTELASRVFDHVSMRYKKGFRLLTLGWTDGCTFLPINYSLLASNDDEKVLGPCNKIDRRTIAGKRRLMARQKATSVMVDLLKTALAAGHKAKYVLFDSWFSNPKQLLDIKKLGLNTIAMVKRSSKRFYIMISEVADITYHESMQIIVEAMLATVQEEFHIADAQVETFYSKFMSKLPESMQRLLQAA